MSCRCVNLNKEIKCVFLLLQPSKLGPSHHVNALYGQYNKNLWSLLTAHYYLIIHNEVIYWPTNRREAEETILVCYFNYSYIEKLTSPKDRNFALNQGKIYQRMVKNFFEKHYERCLSVCLLVRSPCTHSLFIIGWWYSNPRTAAMWDTRLCTSFLVYYFPVNDGSGPPL